MCMNVYEYEVKELRYLFIVLPHQGVKLVLAGDGSEHYVAYELTFIKFIQRWIELFSAGA